MTRAKRIARKKAAERRHQAQFGRQHITGNKKDGTLVLGPIVNLSPNEGRRQDIIQRGWWKLMKAFTPYKNNLGGQEEGGES